MPYQRLSHPFWERHPWITGMLLMLGTLPVTEFPTAFLIGAATAAALVAARRYRRNREIHRAGLRARADLEHRLALSGDPRGIHGRFPPVQAGWFPDPAHARRIRYFDGASWTGHTAAR